MQKLFINSSNVRYVRKCIVYYNIIKCDSFNCFLSKKVYKISFFEEQTYHCCTRVNASSLLFTVILSQVQLRHFTREVGKQSTCTRTQVVRTKNKFARPKLKTSKTPNVLSITSRDAWIIQKVPVAFSFWCTGYSSQYKKYQTTASNI